MTVPEHLVELVAAARERRAERRRERAEFQANRAAGLRARHHTKLARQQPATQQPKDPA